MILCTLRIFSIFTILYLPQVVAVELQQEADQLIIVTGSHIPLTENQIGSSYTIITAAEIEQRQIVLVSDILKDVPGFAVSRSGGIGTQTQIRVRGAEANHLLVLIDGIEANDLSSGEFDFAHLLAGDIERIEIIRGPQSALYGSDALAGVVNIITKQGDAPTTLSGRFESGLPNRVYGSGGLSVRDAKYYYSMQAAYLNTSGNNIAMDGNEEDAYNNVTFSFKTGIDTTDNLKFDSSGRFTRSSSEFDEFDFINNRVIDADLESKIEQDYLQGSMSFNLFENKWQHLVGAAFSSMQSDTFNQGIEIGGNKSKKLKFNYQTNIHFETPIFPYITHSGTFAVEYEKDSFIGRRLRASSLVAGYQASVWQRLFLTMNVRNDDNSDFKDSTTYRMTAAYTLPEFNARLHASYGTGVKTPTFYERFGSFLEFVGNPDLKPEENRSWDIGIEQSFWHSKAKIGLTYFNAKLEDEINGFNRLPSGGFTAINMDGTSRRQGIEVIADINLLENTELTSSYSWLDATQPSGAMESREVRRPRHSANVNLVHTFLNQKAQVNLNFSFTGEQIDAGMVLDDYMLVNVAASYDISDNISLYSRIENIFDKNYQDILGYQPPGVAGILGVKITFQQ